MVIRVFQGFMISLITLLIFANLFEGIGVPLKYSVLILMAGQIASLFGVIYTWGISDDFSFVQLVDVVLDYLAVFLVELWVLTDFSGYIERGIPLYVSAILSFCTPKQCKA